MRKPRLLLVALVSILLVSCKGHGSTQSLVKPSLTTSLIASDTSSKQTSTDSKSQYANTSISSENQTSNDITSERELYVPQIDGYTNMIDKPSLVVHKLSDITAVMDYYAYYYVDKFEIELADDYQYFVGEENFDKEMNAAYWAEELVNGVMGMLHKKQGNKVEITYVHYDRNSIELEKTLYNGIDLSYAEGNYNSNLSFASDDESKKLVDVTDSQQLFYAVQHGYRVNVKPNSPAERIYNKAKGILNKIISSEMDYLQKVYAIYDYLEHNTVYDYNAIGDDIPEPSDPEMLPDEYASPYMCYYIEGCLDNNCCVCDGYAKTMSLLCNMVGINCIRDSGTSDKMWTSREVAGHAYNYVEYENKWYLCCPTWGQTRNGTINYNYSGYLMTAIDWSSSFYCYAGINTPDYVNLASYANDYNDIELLRRDRFMDKYVTYNGEQYSCYVTSMEQYQAIVNRVKEVKGSYASIYVDSRSLISDIDSSYTQGIGTRIYTYGKNILPSYEVTIYNTGY